LLVGSKKKENSFLSQTFQNWKEFNGKTKLEPINSFELHFSNQIFTACVDPIVENGKVIYGSIAMIKTPSIDSKQLSNWNQALSPEHQCTGKWILDQIEHAIIATDLGGTIKFWNRGAANLYGWNEDEVIGRNIVEITPSSLTRGQGKEIMKRLTQGNSWYGEFEVQKRDSSKFIAHVVDAPMRDLNNNLVGIIGISYDHTPFVRQRDELLVLKKSLEILVEQRTKELVNTNDQLIKENVERRRAQEELELLSLVAKKMDMGVIITDSNHSLKFGNDSFLKLTGCDSKEILNRTPLDILKLIRVELKTMDLIQEALSNDTSLSLDIDITNKSEELLTFATEVTPVFDDRGNRTHSVMVMKNITEKLKIDAAMQKANEEAIANKWKTQYITTLSHELRTPLNAIIGMTGLMKNGDLSNQSQIRKDLETVQCCSEILLLLVNNVLDLRKIESGKVEMVKEVFELGTAVKEVVRACEPLSAQKSVIITLENSCTVDYVVGDVTKLKQILVNLCANAIKFTHPYTEIHVTIELRSSTDQEICLLFSVKDNGPGIPAEKFDQLFKKFSQLHDWNSQSVQGSGLGLSISKELVSILKGTIWVDSQVGKGSTFRFTANFEKITEKEENQIKSNKSIANGTFSLQNTFLNILLAEDNPVNQKVMVRMLERVGMKCDIANNGREALIMSEEKFYDVIFMDVMMPEMNGIEATEAILKSSRRAPRIVGLTANATPEYIEHCRAVGMSEVLTKPTSLEKIQQALLNTVKSQVLTIK